MTNNSAPKFLSKPRVKFENLICNLREDSVKGQPKQLKVFYAIKSQLLSKRIIEDEKFFTAKADDVNCVKFYKKLMAAQANEELLQKNLESGSAVEMSFSYLEAARVLFREKVILPHEIFFKIFLWHQNYIRNAESPTKLFYLFPILNQLPPEQIFVLSDLIFTSHLLRQRNKCFAAKDEDDVASVFCDVVYKPDAKSPIVKNLLKSSLPKNKNANDSDSDELENASNESGKSASKNLKTSVHSALNKAGKKMQVKKKIQTAREFLTDLKKPNLNFIDNNKTLKDLPNKIKKSAKKRFEKAFKRPSKERRFSEKNSESDSSRDDSDGSSISSSSDLDSGDDNDLEEETKHGALEKKNNDDDPKKEVSSSENDDKKEESVVSSSSASESGSDENSSGNESDEEASDDSASSENSSASEQSVNLKTGTPKNTDTILTMDEYLKTSSNVVISLFKSIWEILKNENCPTPFLFDFILNANMADAFWFLKKNFPIPKAKSLESLFCMKQFLISDEKISDPTLLLPPKNFEKIDAEFEKIKFDSHDHSNCQRIFKELSASEIGQIYLKLATKNFEEEFLIPTNIYFSLYSWCFDKNKKNKLDKLLKILNSMDPERIFVLADFIHFAKQLFLRNAKLKAGGLRAIVSRFGKALFVFDKNSAATKKLLNEGKIRLDESDAKKSKSRASKSKNKYGKNAASAKSQEPNAITETQLVEAKDKIFEGIFKLLGDHYLEKTSITVSAALTKPFLLDKIKISENFKKLLAIRRNLNYQLDDAKILMTYPEFPERQIKLSEISDEKIDERRIEEFLKIENPQLTICLYADFMQFCFEQGVITKQIFKMILRWWSDCQENEKIFETREKVLELKSILNDLPTENIFALADAVHLCEQILTKNPRYKDFQTDEIFLIGGAFANWMQHVCLPNCHFPIHDKFKLNCLMALSLMLKVLLETDLGFKFKESTYLNTNVS